ncbi:MAG: hypothetical protein ACLTGI_01460 [Hoylesella buccalis]
MTVHRLSSIKSNEWITKHTIDSVVIHNENVNYDATSTFYYLFQELSALASCSCAQVAVMAQRHKAIVIQPKDTLSFFRHVAVSGDLVGLAQMQFSDYGQ